MAPFQHGQKFFHQLWSLGFFPQLRAGLIYQFKTKAEIFLRKYKVVATGSSRVTRTMISIRIWFIAQMYFFFWCEFLQAPLLFLGKPKKLSRLALLQFTRLVSNYTNYSSISIFISSSYLHVPPAFRLFFANLRNEILVKYCNTAAAAPKVQFN